MAGFDARGRLVVLSHDGYGIIDPVSLETVERDREFDASAALSLDRLTFRVPSTGEVVAMWGLWGGDGSHMTGDGWVVGTVQPWWPRVRVVLWRPFVSGQTDYFAGATVIYDVDGTWRGVGFSPDGRHLAIVESTALGFFSRP